MPHDLCPARALRARVCHGVRAKERGRRRGDRHLRARCDPTDHRPARGRARSPAAGGVRRGSAAEERLVQPGNRPGAAHHGHGRRLSPPAHARAHAGRGTRRLRAGAARTPAGGDRRAVRSAEPALGRSGGSAAALARTVAASFADAAASRRCGERRETACRRRAGCRARRPGCGRGRSGRRLPGVGRQDGRAARDDASCARPVPRRSFLHRHLRKLHARGRPRIPGAGRPRHRGRLFARLPRGRRRPALAEGEDAADRYRPGRGQPGPGGGASSPASRRAPGRRGVDRGAACRQPRLAKQCDCCAHPRFEARQPRIRDRAGAARPAPTWSRRWKRPCRRNGRW